ncbi:MAG: VOC family protein [Pseudomonadota bacterium]
MIDHFNLPVSDLAETARFYERVLSCLGYRRVAQDGPAIGFGTDSWAFGIIETRDAIAPLHLAFKAGSEAEVDAFYKAGLSEGAADNGAPGLRPEYGGGYYAAYLCDPDGHNIEAVFRG